MIKQTKTLIVFAALTMLFSCKKEECREPAPPYGTPDTTIWYVGQNFKGVTFTYYCLNGKYYLITYVEKEECTWERSDYVTAGFCKK